jgi:Cof subfamily protein (haloacid dehalogenase superfamily)
MIDSIVTDLDGTLLSPDGTISVANKAILKKAMDKGIRIILASGRRYISAERFAIELGIDDYIIAYSGAWVKKPSEAEPIIKHEMPCDAAAEYIKLVMGKVDLVGAYVDDTFYVQQCNDALERYEAKSHLKAVEVDDVSDFLLGSKNNPTKIFTLAKPEILEIIIESMNARFFGKLDFVKSWETYLEVGPVGITKGSALRKLADILNLDLANSVFFGDHDNDIPGMEVCGTSVAMGNATPGVKARADIIAPDNCHDGVAAVLERMI